MANKSKTMIVLIVIAATATIVGAAAYAIREILKVQADEEKSNTSSRRHSEIQEDISKIPVNVASVLKRTATDSSLREQLVVDYPFGYILYGYDNGIETRIPLDPHGDTKITCDLNSLKVVRDSTSDKFIIHLKDVTYRKAIDTPVEMIIENFEWKFAVDLKHPQQVNIPASEKEGFSAIIEFIEVLPGERVAFVLAFLDRPIAELERIAVEGGTAIMPGFYARRIARLEELPTPSTDDDLGEARGDYADALINAGELARGFEQYQRSISLLEETNSKNLDYYYGNYAWHLVHHKGDMILGEAMARKAKDRALKDKTDDLKSFLMINSVLAKCLLNTGRKIEASSLLRENFVLCMEQYYKEKNFSMQEMEIAARNFGNSVSKTDAILVHSELSLAEQEAFRKVHGHLRGYSPVVKLSK